MLYALLYTCIVSRMKWHHLKKKKTAEMHTVFVDVLFCCYMYISQKYMKCVTCAKLNSFHVFGRFMRGCTSISCMQVTAALYLAMYRLNNVLY